MFLVPIFKVNIDLHINAFLSEKVAMHKKKDGLMISLQGSC